MRRGITGFSIFALCAGMTLAQDNYTQWSAKKTLTINTQASGMNVANTVTKFPTLIRLTSANADVFAGAKGKGADIRFAKTDNTTHLKYQIERWDSAAKAAEIWVLMDTVYGNANTSLNMYWGKSSAADSSTNAVFDTGNGFVGVWHLGNAPKNNPRPSSVTGAPPAILRNYDSTSYTAVSGIIGLADTLAGSQGQGDITGLLYNYIDFGRSNYPGFANFNSGFTFSVWIYESAQVPFERFIEMLDDSTTSASSDTRIILFGNKNPPVNGASVRWGANGIFNGANSNTYGQNAWYHLVFTKPGGSNPMTIYSNGAQIEQTGALPDLAVGVRNFVFMGRSSVTASDPYYQGKFDEPVIGNQFRSADWVKLSYQTQRADSNATFITFGATVVPAPTAVTYAPNPAVYTVGFAIPASAPTVSGGAASHFTASALPAGLVIDSVTGIISGTPIAASSATNDTITASNGAGSVKVALNITVNAALVAPTALSYSTPVTYALNKAITNNSPTITGTATNYVVNPGLPPGLSLSATTGVISGTPTAATAAANYVVTASNTAGSVNATVNVAVLAAPSAFSYSKPVANYATGIAIASNTPVVTGTVASYSVSPALSPGLSLNTTTGVISGTPTNVQVATPYTITATNVAGSATTTVNFTIYGAPSSIAYATNPVSYTIGQVAVPDSAIVVGFITHYSVAPALPTGLKLDTNTGVISGTPTASVASSSYTVTASNPVGYVTVVLTLATPVSIAGSVVPNSYVVRLSGSSSISFRIPEGASQLQLSLMDMSGRIVWSNTLVASKMNGAKEFTWNGSTNDGQRASSGLYIVHANIINASNGSTKTLEQKINYNP